MAGVKIKELPKASSYANEDEIIIEQDGETKRLPLAIINNTNQLSNYYDKNGIQDLLNNKTDTTTSDDLQRQIDGLDSSKADKTSISDLENQINTLDSNKPNEDEVVKISQKGAKNGVATLNETGTIPQSQIGVMTGVDLLYSGSNNAPPTVTITGIPTGYKYYELLIYGKGGYTIKNSLKINDLLIKEIYTSSNNGFFIKAIITDKVYCSANTNGSYYDGILPATAMVDFKEGIFIGKTLNKITIDTAANTSGEVKYITLFGYK